MSPVETSNLDRDIAIIKDRYGKNSIHRASENPPVFRIPLDSPGMMRITSGGIPFGRVTRLWGPPSSGKSLFALSAVKAAQGLVSKQYSGGLECAYYNVEKVFDKLLAKYLGIDIDRLVIRETDIIEDIGRDVQLLLGSCHLHVIDSCSEGVSQDRLASDVGDWGKISLRISAWEKSFEFIMNALGDENVIINIDHETSTFAKPSKQNPTGYKAPKALGGKEMEHVSSMSIHFAKGKWLFYDENGLLQTEDKLKEKGILGIGGQKEADGQEIVVEVNKSRVCRPLRKANLRLDLNTLKFDHTFELMQGSEYYDKWGNIAHRSGTVAIAHKKEAKGGWATLPSGENVQGERALRNRIEEDKELADMIRKAMLAGN